MTRSISYDGLRRDQYIALMVAERDAELRGAAPLHSPEWLDDVDRNSQAVELRAMSREGPVAVEHTIIESYSEQIRDRNALLCVFPGGGPPLDDIPDAGHYQLLLPTGAMASIPRRSRVAVAGAITSWVEDNLGSVPWPHRPGSPTFVRGRIADFPLDLALQRWTDSIQLVGPLARVVRVVHSRPPDLEARRVDRLVRALAKKSPKLLRALPDRGRSILILADQDISMSAPAFVSSALCEAGAGLRLPDAIYLLNTTAGDPLLMTIVEPESWYHLDGGTWMTFSTARAAEFNTRYSNLSV